jgi:hypothetical protein
MERARYARQPALGLAGITLVIPVVLFLGAAWGGPERSLLVLGPMSTFALPLIAMIAFWWEDWPGTVVRPPLTGLIDTVLVAVGGVVSTIVGQAIVEHVDLRGVFDPGAGPAHAATFPLTMPLAGAIFVVMLQLTLVSEGWPFRRLNRIAGGVAALVASWAIAIPLYEVLVAGGARLPGGQFGAALVCIGVLQVAFYVVLRGWPFSSVRSQPPRLSLANVALIAGGVLVYLVLAHAADLEPATISAVGGAAVAAGLVVGMLFEGWLGSTVPALVAVGAVTAVLYFGLTGFADAIDWTRAEPEEWVAYAGLNAIGAGVILHVAIGHRWPFALPEERRGAT